MYVHFFGGAFISSTVRFLLPGYRPFFRGALITSGRVYLFGGVLISSGICVDFFGGAFIS